MISHTKSILILSTIFFHFHVMAAGHVDFPKGKEKDLYQMDLRYFKKNGSIRYLGELQSRTRINGDRASHFRFGANYRVANFAKLGLYYRFQEGVRSINDWQDREPNWKWLDDPGPIDNVLIPEVTLRTMIFDKLRGEFRTQYHFNLTNGEQTVLLRPGLTYFWFRKGQPFLNIYTQLEEFLPTNVHRVTTSERWIYFGFLYHLHRNHKVGLSYARVFWDWTESENFVEQEPNVGYHVRDRANIYGLTYIFTH